ncbi:MAG TPA: dipeptide epimerase [Candidatus Sumerlaeota bacterium]|nr:dipeptide epimerase [Candidatus Sumerlaeota bacterium]
MSCLPRKSSLFLMMLSLPSIDFMEIYSGQLPLSYPSAVAYCCQEEAPLIFVRLRHESGMEGWGVAAPDPHVTGETPAAVTDFLASETARNVIKRGFNPQIAEMSCTPDLVARHNPAACAAISMAMADLQGRLCGMPVYALLNGRPRPIPTSYTISLLPMGDSLRQVRMAIKHGFSILKIKLGEDAKSDALRVKEIRRETGPGVKIRLDANQAYTPEEALRLVSLLDSNGIEFLEQPTPAQDLEGLEFLASQSPLPIMADESALNSGETRNLLSRGIVRLVNIKLMKCGGIEDALATDRICGEFRASAMIGCMDESSLSITASLHVMLGSRHIQYADLDGHVDIEGDPADGSLLLRDGILYPPIGPGLGMRVSLEALSSFERRRFKLDK